MSEMPENSYSRREEMTQNQVHVPEQGAPRWVWLAVVVFAAVSILGLAVGWNATTHARHIEDALATRSKESQAFQQHVDALSQRLSQAEETNAHLQNALVSVTDRLKMTQGEILNTQRQSTKTRDEYSTKLSGVQSELANKASADDVRSLGGDVNGVKSDLEATKNSLGATRDEFGTLIARNHDEIDQLRRMGERDYFEFTLAGKGNRSKVGELMVELRGTNTKRNQFTVALYVDDMRLEKKNRSIDEPIYFYTRGTRTPLEFVVNEVGKNKVAGYLSVPKSRPAAAAAASGN
jgi:hypothetical protein